MTLPNEYDSISTGALPRTRRPSGLEGPMENLSGIKGAHYDVGKHLPTTTLFLNTDANFNLNYSVSVCLVFIMNVLAVVETPISLP